MGWKTRAPRQFSMPGHDWRTTAWSLRAGEYSALQRWEPVFRRRAIQLTMRYPGFTSRMHNSGAILQPRVFAPSIASQMKRIIAFSLALPVVAIQGEPVATPAPKVRV